MQAIFFLKRKLENFYANLKLEFILQEFFRKFWRKFALRILKNYEYILESYLGKLKIIFQNDTIRVIWAMDKDDPKDETTAMIWHGKLQRGSKSLNLRNPSVKPFEKSTKYLDFKVPNVS